jgi:hypothetical protein
MLLWGRGEGSASRHLYSRCKADLVARWQGMCFTNGLFAIAHLREPLGIVTH